MHRLTAAAVLVFAFAAGAQEKDVEGSKDHPLLTRMPGFYIANYEAKEFDSVDVSAYLSGADAKWEGKYTKINYSLKSGTRQTSMVQLARNQEAALKKIGAKILGGGDRVTLAKLEKGGATTYVQASAFNEGRDYELIIVEAKAMEQEVVADAAALKAGIAATGKVALYGIFFDTNKSVVKPESEPTLKEITKLLKDNPKLKIFVVGHTDGVGALEANLKLSNDRAAAVVQVLVARGIEAARLKPAGVGPYSPEATNNTDEGRAKNRRVELVERLQ